MLIKKKQFVKKIEDAGLKTTINNAQAHISMLETILDTVGAYIFTKDTQGRYTYVNKQTLALFDKPLEEVIGFDDSYFFDLNVSNQLRENDLRVLRDKQIVETEEHNHVKATGELRGYRSVKKPLFDENGVVIGMCGISTDITVERELQRTVNEQRTLLNTVLDNIDAHVYMKSSDRRFLYVNQKVANLFGDSADNIIGKLDEQVIPKEVADHFWQSDKKVFETNEKQVTEEIINNDDGTKYHYLSVKMPYHYDDNTSALIGFSTDVTELYKLKEEFKRQASTDELTNLFNRRYFFEQAEKELGRARRHNSALSLIAIDIDYFKKINDQYGHPAGDAALIEVANNLKNMARNEDIVARIGGEEFSLLLPQTDLQEAIKVAERICLYHNEFPCEGIDGQQYPLTLSIGVSTLSESDADFSSLVTRADQALYQAKQSGRNKVAF